jgi:hypothetical protein
MAGHPDTAVLLPQKVFLCRTDIAPVSFGRLMRARSRSTALLTALTALAFTPAAASADVTRATVDGPSADLGIPEYVDVDAAADGTAAIAYLKKVGGVLHVFVSDYENGAWTAAQRVDTGQADASSVPAVEALGGGKTVVAWTNGPTNAAKLYAASRTTAGGGFAPPATVEGDPAGWNGVDLDLAANGNGYLTAYEGFHLHAYRIENGAFLPVGGAFPSAASILNGAAGQQANYGIQYGARIATLADGASAIIAWSEDRGGGEHTVWGRKLTGTTPGTAVDLQAGPLLGRTPDHNSNDDVSVATGGGTTWVSWHAGYDYGGGTSHAHGVVRTFDGTNLGPTQRVDNIPEPATQNAEFPKVAVNASGQGLATTYLGPLVNDTQASVLSGATWGAGIKLNPGPNASPGQSTVALEDNGVGLVAYRHEAAAGAGAKIRSRVFGGVDDDTTPELSDASFGSAGAPYESAAGGGKAFTAFMQTSGAASRVVAAVVTLPALATTPIGTTPGTPPTTGDIGPVIPPLTLTGLKFRKSSFARGKTAPAIVSAKSSKRALSFTLSRAATVVLTVSKITPGRRDSGGGCVAETKKNRKTAKKCDHLTPVKTTASLQAPAGTTNLAFTGALRKNKQLAIGKYLLRVDAEEGSPLATKSFQTAKFTLTAAKKTTKK